MVKSIIKRILVGVGIALILMLIKDHGLILQASAKTYNIIPKELRLTYTNTNNTTNTTTYTSLQEVTDTQYPYNTFYGRSNINGDYYVYQQLYRLEATSSMKSGFYDIHYLFYTDTSFQEVQHLIQPFSFNLRNNGRVFTCTNDNGGGQGTSQTVPINNRIINVTCSNVYLDLENFDVVYAMIEQSHTKTLIGTAYGISAVNFQWGALNSQVEVSNAIQETNDTIKDDSVDNNKAESDIGTMNSKIASNGSITSLVTLPITLYQSILNSVNGSCSPISLGSLYGHSLSMSCINLQNLLGSTLYNIIDILCCGLFILAFRKKMVDIFNHMTSLNDRGNEVE